MESLMDHDTASESTVASRSDRSGGGALPSIVWPLLVMLPTIFSILYYGIIASPRYVSEARIVVRTASKPISAGPWGALLQMSGLSRSNDDVYAVQSYFQSISVMEQLLEKLPLRDMYNRSSADPLARYPSLFFGSSREQLRDYLSWMITSTYSTTTGILALKVQAFTPQDAKAIADELLVLAERTVNRLNSRIQADAVRVSASEVQSFEKRLIDAQIALTNFRHAELTIDPRGSSIMVAALIGRLSAELAGLNSQIRETAAAAPQSPGLIAMRRKARAISDQIAQERLRISSNEGGLAESLARYERLVLRKEYAKFGLTSALSGLEKARTEARRQQLYLEHIVKPHVPDYANEPRRLWMIWSVFGMNLLTLLVGWLLYSGIRSHNANA